MTATQARELINNGFNRAELASLADAQATKVYSGAHAQGSVVASKITGAVENYQSAIHCFVKALPFLPEDGSAELVRNEIRRLMARLGELQQILSEVTGEPVQPKVDDNQERQLLADLLFRVGDRVQVLLDDNLWHPGTVTSVDYENGTYTVQLDEDGSEHSNITGDKLRAHNDADSERQLIVSEIVENERVFRDQLRFLIRYYLVPLSKPQHWGGQRSQEETLFSQKTVTASEMKTLFGNIEEIAGTSEVFHASLDGRFQEWHADQKLGDIFLTFAQFFVAFAIYADCVRTSVDLLTQLRKERSSFDAVIQGAQDRGAPPLETLMRAPMTRVADYKRLLDRLIHRTPSTHPDYETLRQAFLAIGRVENEIDAILNRKENQRKVREIEQMFKPTLNLITPSRLLVRFSKELKHMEDGKPHKRLVWLFNDLILIGRNSEWLAVGSFRHISDCLIKNASAAPQFGPLAFEVFGRNGEDHVFIASSPEEKKEWLMDLKAFGTGSVGGKTTPTSMNQSLSSPQQLMPATQRQVEISKNKRSKSPSQMMSELSVLDGDWKQLQDTASGKTYYYSPSLQKTTWERPRWRPALAKYNFDAVDANLDASFTQGEKFEIMLEGCDDGWARARFPNRVGGLVPLNRVDMI